LVENIEQQGSPDPARATASLEQFELGLAMHLAYRDRILREFELASAGLDGRTRPQTASYSEAVGEPAGAALREGFG
jgi:hypothetical protein